MKQLVIAVILLFSMGTAANAQKQLHQEDFIYQGAFRVGPGLEGGQHGWGYSTGKMAFNANDPNDPNDDTIYISNHVYSDHVAEVTIPEPIQTNDINQLNVAIEIQPLQDPTDGLIDSEPSFNYSTRLGGLLVYNGKLIWTAYEYYDADHTATKSHGYSPLDMSGQAQGMFKVDGNGKNVGHVAGYMCTVPSNWQDQLGYPALTGLSSISIAGRTSAGPSAFGFDPDNLGVVEPVPSTRFLGYEDLWNSDETSMGGFGMGSQNPLYNHNSNISGMIFPEGTDSLVFFGKHGLGTVCYGTGDECNDPHNSYKGYHDVGGNYVYQAWAFDPNDLLDVKNGVKNPWEIVPYDYWNFDLPMNTYGNKGNIGNAAYDPYSNTVYLAARQGSGLNVHVYSLGEGTIPDPDPTPDPDPIPDPEPEPDPEPDPEPTPDPEPSLPAPLLHWEFEVPAPVVEVTAPDVNFVEESLTGDQGTPNGFEITSSTIVDVQVNGPFETGKIGSALSLDGNSYVDVSNVNLPTNAVTVSAWVKSNVSDTHDNRIFSKASTWYGESHDLMVSTYRVNSNNRLRFRLKTNGTTKTLVADSGHLSADTWHHVCATYDGTQMKLYLNGAEVGSTSATGTITYNDVPTLIGVNYGGSSTNSRYGFWNGAIDDLKIYDQALSQEQVLLLSQ